VSLCCPDLTERHVVVIDIGGGFSLFEVRPVTSGSIPDIRRVAVSEHILLGGDNIDLALAGLPRGPRVRDSALEQEGFEPLVPLLRKAHLGVANRETPGTKGGATYRFRPETAMLAWSGSA